MSKKEFAPNGVSFEQIKKYAKRLKKESSLTNQQALNQIVKEQTNFNNWEQLINYNKSRLGCLGKISQGENTTVIYGDKPVYLMDFNVGTGAKSLIFKKQCNKMLFVTEKVIVPSVKRDIKALDIDPDKVIITTFDKLYKKDIRNDDIDMIVLDEFHLSKIKIDAVLKCYKYAQKNRVLTYQFGMLSFYKVIRTGCYGSTAWDKERFQSAIANPEAFYIKSLKNNNPLPYELFDYQKEAIEEMQKRFKKQN